MMGAFYEHRLIDEHGDGAGQAFEAVFEYEVDGLGNGGIGVLLFGHVCVLVVADTLMRAPVAGQRNWLDPAATAQAASSGSATLRLRMRPAREGFGLLYRTDVTPPHLLW